MPARTSGYTRGGDGSHWETCQQAHWDCRLAHVEDLLDEIDDALPKGLMEVWGDGTVQIPVPLARNIRRVRLARG